MSRGRSGEAGVAACGGGSGSSSSVGSGGGSGEILFLIVVVILLLFACPLLSALSFPFSSLAALSAGCRLPAFNAQWLVVVCSEVEVEVVAVAWLRRPVDLRPQRILTPAPPPPPPRVRHCPTASSRYHPLLPPLPLLLLLIPLLPLPRGVNRREGVPLPRLTPSPLARRASLL